MLNQSRPHGAPTLLAIERYSEIEELVNMSLALVELANRTVNNITQKVISEKISLATPTITVRQRCLSWC